jgi:hypothetical protein
VPVPATNTAQDSNTTSIRNSQQKISSMHQVQQHHQPWLHVLATEDHWPNYCITSSALLEHICRTAGAAQKAGYCSLLATPATQATLVNPSVKPPLTF